MQECAIRINGHSGCNVDIVFEMEHAFIKKTTYSNEYAERLKTQIHKQKTNPYKIADIYVPPVYGEFHFENCYYALMDYVDGYDFFSFAEIATIEQLDTFFEKVLSIVDFELSESQLSNFPVELFCKKIESILQKIEGSFMCEEIYKYKSDIEKFDSLKIPLGYCHGDLTFSNICIKRDLKSIYLIDFLDSFIETPIQDIVKIQQDTLYKWSLIKLLGQNNLARYHIILDYLNNKLDKYCKEKKISQRIVAAVQAVNLLRILPYTKDNEIRDVLYKAFLQEKIKMEGGR